MTRRTYQTQRSRNLRACGPDLHFETFRPDSGTDALWRSATDIADAYSLRSKKGEFSGEYTVQVGAEDMMRHPHIVRWPLNDRILDIVETYLGLPEISSIPWPTAGRWRPANGIGRRGSEDGQGDRLPARCR
jgi:hypothetical protein